MRALRPIERQVLACAGTPPDQVAAALSVPVETVRAARARCGRRAEDGLPLGAVTHPSRELEREDDFDAMMRRNRSVCE